MVQILGVFISWSPENIFMAEFCKSNVKFWIIGLSYDTNEAVLKDAFGRHGEIIEGNVVDFLVVTYYLCL